MQILKFEFLKIIKNKSVIGAGIVLLLSISAVLFIGFFYSQLSSSNHSSISGRTMVERNLDFANKYKGELTDQKVKAIVSDYLEVYQDKVRDNAQIFDYFQWSVIDTFTFAGQQDIYLEMTDAVKEERPYTIDDINLLSMKEVGYPKLDFPITIGNFMTWTILLRVIASAFIPVALFIILFCSILFANDSSKNIIPLLLSTKFGRTKMIQAKIWVGTILTMVSFLITQLIILFSFGIFFGFSGWDVSVQANLDWKVFDFPLEWNMFQVYLFGIFFYLVGLLFVAGVTMLVSSLCSSPFSSLAISLGIFFLPQVLTHVFLKGIPNKILYLFPINTFEIDKVLLWMSRDNMFFFRTFVANIGMIIIVMIGMKMILDAFVYSKMNKLHLR